MLEQEFAQVLKVLSREGNTLSPIVRQAWDGDALQTMVRNNPLRASAAHVGIVGHITKDELLRYLTATELANGFQNRFLLIAVDRSKLLPFGSALDAGQLAEVRDAVRLGLRFAGAPRALPLDPAARERWIEIYPRLSASRPGLAGAATARAEAHVVRLGLIYALLDCSDTIGLEHLDAGLAVWRYSADSAAWIFGDSLGDPTADEIWAATQGAPGWRDAHRGLGHVQPQQETPRDRPRPVRARGRRTAAARDPPARTRPARRGVDPGHRPRSLTDRSARAGVVECFPIHDRRINIKPDIDPGRTTRAHRDALLVVSAPSERSRAPAPAPARQRPGEPRCARARRSARQAPDPSGSFDGGRRSPGHRNGS